MLPRVNPLSGVFGESWEMYKAHWRHFASIALLIYVVVGTIGILLTASFGRLGVFLSALLSIAGTFWLQGALIEAVRDVRDGRTDLSVSETFSQVLPRLNRIVVAGIALALAIAVGLVLLVVPGLIILTIWLMVIPAIVLEDRGIGDSFGRSRELVSGSGWNVFGAIVITFLILIAVSLVLSLILLPLDSWLAALIQQVVGNTIVAPFAVVVWTLVYYRLLAAKEPPPAAAAP
jgi:hypothetical protein